MIMSLPVRFCELVQLTFVPEFELIAERCYTPLLYNTAGIETSLA